MVQFTQSREGPREGRGHPAENVIVASGPSVDFLTPSAKCPSLFTRTVPAMHGNRLSLIAAVATLALFWVIGLRFLSVPVTVIVGLSMVLGFGFWLRFLYGRPADPKVILPPFLVMLSALTIHKMEEYYRGFPQAISALFDVRFTLETFVLVFVQIGPMLYFLVILGLFLRNEYSNFFASFLIIGMAAAEATHFLFPLIEGGSYHYFPGMYTAILPIVTGIWTVVALVRASRHHVHVAVRSRGDVSPVNA